MYRATKLESPQERLHLVLLALARDQAVEELSTQAGVSRGLLYRWMRGTREAALKALEAKKPGRRPQTEPAPELERKVEELEAELARLRKEKEALEKVVDTAQSVIRRNNWDQPDIKKKRGRPRRDAAATSRNGNASAVAASAQAPSPAPGGSAATRTGDGSQVSSKEPVEA